MTTEIFVDLTLIAPNPFQPRKAVDPAAVVELAENIERNTTDEFDGLLQAPTARQAGVTYELAFGHTRLEAMRSLGREGMRLQVRELTDLQMFEIAVSENIKRRDLNPIEQAEAIQTYMERFGKTSAEAAEFFGVAASTVRGSVRLLNLPEAAQEKVRTGEFNTAAARALLVVEKLLGESGVEEVIEAIATEEDGPLEAIANALRGADETVLLDRDAGWVKADPFPQKYWKPLTEKEIRTLVIEEDENELDAIEGEDLARLVSFAGGGMEITDNLFPMFSPDGLERVRVAANPPGCLACPLHAQLDGDHYCSLRACANRKTAAWYSETTARVSKETGIPVYDKGRDGAFGKLNMYNDENATLFRERQDDLRLTPATSEVFGNFQIDLDAHVQVVVVGKTLAAMQKKDERQRVKEEKKQAKELPWEVRSNISHTVGEFTLRLLWETASKVFATLLDGVTNFAVLNHFRYDARYPGQLDEDELVEEAKGMKKADGLAQMRRIVAMGLLDRETRYNSEVADPIVVFGGTVAELAKEFGVKLPKDWNATVKTLQAECAAAVEEIMTAYRENG